MYLKRQSGFTYLAILFVIAIAGVLVAQTGINWTQSGQRDKERDLLFAGNQFRQAIAQYYERTPGVVKQYPKKLEDLLADSRFNPVQHYLRKIYFDPFTNSQEWGLSLSPQGGIMGVYSKSAKVPIKTASFAYLDQAFEGAGKYSDWVFLYVPAVIVAR